MINDDITYQIIGCAMKVHNNLGPGFQEVIYQRCLAIEFDRQNLDYTREHSYQIFYDGTEVGSRRADFIVNDEVVVELKALVKLEDVHLAQAKNYTVAFGYAIGLLINFGGTSLQYKRIYNPSLNTPKKEP